MSMEDKLEANRIINGNCLGIMKTFPSNSIDSIVCDPPYALVGDSRGGSLSIGDKTIKFGRSGPSKNGVSIKKGFMGKEWDGQLPSIEIWEEALRVAKPGAHLLAFGGTRTFHRLMVSIEDAGWELRDTLSYNYGSGFPKSIDVSKNIDKHLGIVREDKFEGLGRNISPSGNKKCDICGKWLVSGNPCECPRPQDKPQSDEAKQFVGYGSSLKPAWEPIVMARKPLEGTIANNVLKWGVGGINIDACRIPHNEKQKVTTRVGRKNAEVWSDTACGYDNEKNTIASANPKGRFPANFLLDEQSALLLDEQTGILKSGDGCTRRKIGSFLEHGGLGKPGDLQVTYGDYGGASRFFYTSKCSKNERNEGLDPERPNTHPCVKPLSLMRYLCRLVTPPRGIVLDPFCGSGSTCIAAVQEGFNYIGTELETEYVVIANKRIAYWTKKCKK